MPIESITINNKPIKPFVGGQILQLDVSVNPFDFEEDDELLFESSSYGVASVSNVGFIQASFSGRSTITAYSRENPDIFDSFEINVLGTQGVFAYKSGVVKVAIKEPESLIITNKPTSSLKIGDTLQLIHKFLPEGSRTYPVKWLSSAPDIVSVSESEGVLTALKMGNYTIRCEVDVDAL